jgi:peptidoglycan/xylan/chitin deacetylase (PgdA/CDA1 family)
LSEATAVIHPLGVTPDSPLGQRLEVWSHPRYYRPLAGAFPAAIARVDARDAALAAAADGLPDGPARAEAIAVRLRRSGFSIAWGTPDAVHGAATLLSRHRERGASSVEIIRADPSLLPELQIGSWFDGSARTRALRRALAHAPLQPAAIRHPAALAAAADAAFWAGVRAAASSREWRRLTTSSYVCLYYHRIAGEQKPGEERLDVSPRHFERQLALLRMLGFRPLAADEVAAFHEDPAALLPRRSYVLTADDGFEDATVAFGRHPAHRPQLFVPTARAGETATWAGGGPLATWAELREVNERGIEIGSHGMRHVRMTELDDDALHEELAGSLHELRAQLPRPLPVLAYPHGLHDDTVCAAARAAGYRLAYTTRPGRNGAGTDPYCLRRIGIKEWDTGLSFLWKLVTGEHVPRWWDRRRQGAADGGE